MPILKNEQIPDSPSQFREWEFTEKWILRQAAKPFVTEEIYHRRKLQYNAPISRPSVTETVTPLQVYLKGRLTEESVGSLGWANWAYVKDLLSDYLADPHSPLDGGIDRRARVLLCLSSFIVLGERFGTPKFVAS